MHSSPAAAQSEPFLGQIAWVAFDFAPRGWAECNGQILSIAQNTALFSLLGTTYGGNGTTTFALPDLRGRVAVHGGQGPGLTSRGMGEKGGLENVILTENQMPAHAHTQNPHSHAIGAHTHDVADHSHAIGDHSHSIPSQEVALRASDSTATTVSPGGNVLATASISSKGGKVTNVYGVGPANVNLGPSASTAAGVTGSANGNTSQAGAGTTTAASGAESASATPVINPSGGSEPHENMQPWTGLKCIIAITGIFPPQD
jgi:microcystin-dependent protein